MRAPNSFCQPKLFLKNLPIKSMQSLFLSPNSNFLANIAAGLSVINLKNGQKIEKAIQKMIVDVQFYHNTIHVLYFDREVQVLDIDNLSVIYCVSSVEMMYSNEKLNIELFLTERDIMRKNINYEGISNAGEFKLELKRSQILSITSMHDRSTMDVLIFILKRNMVEILNITKDIHVGLIHLNKKTIFLKLLQINNKAFIIDNNLACYQIDITNKTLLTPNKLIAQMIQSRQQKFDSLQLVSVEFSQILIINSKQQQTFFEISFDKQRVNLIGKYKVGIFIRQFQYGADYSGGLLLFNNFNDVYQIELKRNCEKSSQFFESQQKEDQSNKINVEAELSKVEPINRNSVNSDLCLLSQSQLNRLFVDEDLSNDENILKDKVLQFSPEHKQLLVSQEDLRIKLNDENNLKQDQKEMQKFEHKNSQEKENDKELLFKDTNDNKHQCQLKQNTCNLHQINPSKLTETQSVHQKISLKLDLQNKFKNQQRIEGFTDALNNQLARLSKCFESSLQSYNQKIKGLLKYAAMDMKKAIKKEVHKITKQQMMNHVDCQLNQRQEKCFDEILQKVNIQNCVGNKCDDLQLVSQRKQTNVLTFDIIDNKLEAITEIIQTIRNCLKSQQICPQNVFNLESKVKKLIFLMNNSLNNFNEATIRREKINILLQNKLNELNQLFFLLKSKEQSCQVDVEVNSKDKDDSFILGSGNYEQQTSKIFVFKRKE